MYSFQGFCWFLTGLSNIYMGCISIVGHVGSVWTWDWIYNDIYIYIILLHIFNGEDDHELLSIGMIIICFFFGTPCSGTPTWRQWVIGSQIRRDKSHPWRKCDQETLRSGNKTLLVVSNMNFILHNIWDVILPIDELIFLKMVKTC